MKVYLVRHAQSTQNVMDLKARTSGSDFREVLRRSPEYPLTPEGERQAQSLIAQLAGARIERLYSSPFERALATARIYGDAVGLIPMVIEELREVVPDVTVERRQPSSLRRHYLRSFARMAWSRSGPSWRSEYRRAKSAWSIITAEPAQEIMAVSHGWMITMMLLALRRDRGWQVVSRDVRNAGITLVVSR